MRDYRRSDPAFSLCGLCCALCPMHRMEKGCPGCGGGEGHTRAAPSSGAPWPTAGRSPAPSAPAIPAPG